MAGDLAQIIYDFGRRITRATRAHYAFANMLERWDRAATSFTVIGGIGLVAATSAISVLRPGELDKHTWRWRDISWSSRHMRGSDPSRVQMGPEVALTQRLGLPIRESPSEGPTVSYGPPTRPT